MDIYVTIVIAIVLQALKVVVINVILDVSVIVPNKEAKYRKQERRRKNEWLKKYGRTAKQIARWKKKHKGETIGDKKRW